MHFTTPSVLALIHKASSKYTRPPRLTRCSAQTGHHYLFNCELEHNTRRTYLQTPPRCAQVPFPVRVSATQNLLIISLGCPSCAAETAYLRPSRAAGPPAPSAPPPGYLRMRKHASACAAPLATCQSQPCADFQACLLHIIDLRFVRPRRLQEGALTIVSDAILIWPYMHMIHKQVLIACNSFEPTTRHACICPHGSFA